MMREKHQRESAKVAMAKILIAHCVNATKYLLGIYPSLSTLCEDRTVLYLPAPVGSAVDLPPQFK